MASAPEEREAIHETIANYCFHFDGGEFEDWLDLFAEDGIFDAGRMGTHLGKQGLRAFLQTIHLTGGSPMMKHCVMNEIIKVSGDEATAKSYVLLIRSKGEGTLVNGLAGRYEDLLVKRGTRWLFRIRKVHFDLLGDMR